MCSKLLQLCCVWVFASPWTRALQDPLSMGFSWQEYWGGLPGPPPEVLANLGIELLKFLAWVGGFFTTSTTWEAQLSPSSDRPVTQSDSLWLHGLQHARPPCPSPTPRVYSNSCPLSQWCHPTISSSVIPFSSYLQSFPASRSFQVSQFFESDGQRIVASASASVLPMNIQDWFSLGWTGWISLLSKGLTRVFSNTTVQKHQFFGTQLSL